MKKNLLLAAMLLWPLCVAAQERQERLDSAVVQASRAGKNTPVTFTQVGKSELQASNPSHSLPMSLNLLPSVVTYNEGGTGLGNSAMTIRGSKGSQINVTLNGITLNDAESQEVFWVNIPALTALLSSVQVQRGLGTSASGAGAFGASINMNTAFVEPQPSGRVDMSAGSYNTFMATASAATGLTARGFYASAAYSEGRTDGYIRNAFVQSRSAFAALGWLHGSNSLRFTYLMGQQRSGITWDGIDLEQYAKDRRYNGAGEYYDELGNVYYYGNQTDNYAQHHFQLNYTHAFAGGLTWSNTVNFTPGSGYDEYYKRNRKFKNLGFTDLPEGTPAKSDMVYQKLSRSRLLVYHTNLHYRTALLEVTGGVSLSGYLGDHWGNVLWARELGADYNYLTADWYRNIGIKLDGSAFLRAEYHPSPAWTAFADLQYRGVHYTLDGVDDDWIEYGRREEDRLAYARFWNFFNPRAGVTYLFGRNKVYASAALGHREPGRSDIKENAKGDGAPIEAEKMLDVELGYAFESEPFSAGANLYLMEYWDMLLETGRLSSSGYAVKENVPRSWRRGIELTAAWQPLRWFKADGNATLSLNQIADYTAYVPYEDYSATHPVHYGRTTMLLSPSVIGMLRLSFMPFRESVVALDGKYVGKQYIDNSMRAEMAIPAYWLLNLSVSKGFDAGPGKLTFSGYVNNLLGRLYYASGWRWESYSPETGEIYSGIGVYPQAPTTFMLKMSYSF